MMEKEMHTKLDNEILTHLIRVYNSMAHLHHPDPAVDWWIDGCPAQRSKGPWSIYTQLQEQVNLIGVDCIMAEKFYTKYAAEGLLSQEDFFQCLFFLKQSPS